MGESFFDSHAHLSFDSFEQDLDEVLERARLAGISGIVTIGSGGGEEAFHDALALARQHDWIWATAGIHPHDAKNGSPALLDELEAIATSPDVVAIGETGLDYHYNYSPPEDQRRVFRAQLGIARRSAKPFVLHTREAEEDTLAILTDEGQGLRGVVHCFSGGPALAEAVVEGGLHVSFSGIVTFPKADDVREAVSLVPDHRLLIETDSPFLAPKPNRGRRNEPAWVVEVARTLAEVRGVSIDDVARITDRNSRTLFRLGDSREAPIAYPIRDQLYLNVTNECSLSCVFCPKRRDWTVKGHMLHHAGEPTDDEVRSALETARPDRYREVVFCGLGEPTTRFDLVIALGVSLREKHIRTRLDTDGLSCLRQGRDVMNELARAFDAVSVSLNAADGETYQRLCPSPYGERAWKGAVEFLRAAKTRFDEVTASVVAVPDLDLEPVRRLVEDDIGVRFRVRAYNVVG